ncbi:DUF4422 domain-containing protein [Turicibacter sanguinis]|uniref:DUF4422 domain-containing protein n=1 Tax=Turicibacter sanguinis TaxID=154288 RepID=UPI001898F4DD|nr:DUF4422 domain-containing protein [Turicibacter sanguinis]
MNVKVLVATHKPYQMPLEKIYLPVHVGREGKDDIGYIGDNTGNNISFKNPYYCELTGLYWGVKNIECDYLGLVHYRRHFAMKVVKPWEYKKKFNYVLSEQKINKLLIKYDLIVPKKRKYYVETLYSHYANTHYASHLDETRKIIEYKYPEYTQSFDKIMNRRSGYMFNMFIMKKDLVEQYCEWLFSILEELETKIDISSYSKFQARLYGRVSELLFNVWIEKNSVQFIEVPHMHMEKINWTKKILSFLTAKIFKKKFEKSF